MKRVLAVALILLTACVLFAGCGEQPQTRRTTDAVPKVEFLTVYLDDSMDKSQALRFEEEILKVAHIESAEFIDKDEALESYREQLGDEVLDNLGENPLPYSYRITVDSKAQTDDALVDEIVAQLKQIELVEDGEVIGKVDSVSVRRSNPNATDR